MLQHQTDNSAAFVLTDAARLLRGEIDRCVLRSGLPLTPGAINTLTMIERHEGVRQNVLAEKMGVEPMTVSSYIDRLEALGLVERSTDPVDRRAKVVTLTEGVAQVFDAVGPMIASAYERAMEGIDSSAREALEGALKRMRQNLSRA
ncbi:MarR family winged helix-turn-helix transcriptional regulator [Mangrovibrevibacter kandeliae]|uniref:MarR family winged helix-turn-helix transcriptional regulator n=1 Tax=Mangrovibrevibacter kandeliae TaxID=2968473 RepID=UPI00211988FD|nr:MULTISPECIES: MarR family transcriptional regulator [unclassified Aurantimonas]MCQ8782957.1 MarR family transcriptional regulator [Aurantimonas sp. CSK15Z-1]MCW4115849.1 MarR family transcriptional regulator [Aurantimonas sp. MSK8Z-1]